MHIELRIKRRKGLMKTYTSTHTHTLSGTHTSMTYTINNSSERKLNDKNNIETE